MNTKLWRHEMRYLLGLKSSNLKFFLQFYRQIQLSVHLCYLCLKVGKKTELVVKEEDKSYLKSSAQKMKAVFFYLNFNCEQNLPLEKYGNTVPRVPEHFAHAQS